MCVGDRALAGAVFGFPLVSPGGALCELPFVSEQDVEKRVVPDGGGGCPGDLDAAGDRVGTLSGAVRASPAEALFLQRRGLGFGAHVGVRCGAVRLAEGVASRDQGDGFLVVHGHARERFANIACSGDRVGVSVGALRVDIDQTHLDRGEGFLQFAVAGVPFVVEPAGFGAPVDIVVGFPGVDAAARETECFEAHGFEGDVAGEDEQVGPREVRAVLLFDRPQQTSGLVEVSVVGPAVEGGEALLPGARAAASVADAVGAGAVPCHADHERAVVPEVGGPPVLGVGEEFGYVPLTAARSRLLNASA